MKIFFSVCLALVLSAVCVAEEQKVVSLSRSYNPSPFRSMRANTVVSVIVEKDITNYLLRVECDNGDSLRASEHRYSFTESEAEELRKKTAKEYEQFIFEYDLPRGIYTCTAELTRNINGKERHFAGLPLNFILT